jgi:hypothetical protein
MIGNSVRYGFIQLAHGEGEVGRKAVALSGAARVANERLDEEPVELEAPDQAAKIALERIGRDKAFGAALVAIGEGLTARTYGALGLATEIKCIAIGEAKFLDAVESPRSLFFQRNGTCCAVGSRYPCK